MRWLLLVLGLALLGSPVAARPFTVEDLLSQEGFGAITIAPTGRHVAVERRGPYAAGARFDLGHYNAAAGTQLLLADLRSPDSARALMPQPPGYGYLLGPWSPDGQRLAVYRLGRRRWELGLVEVAARRVRWLGVTPASVGQTVQWRSGEELVVLAADAPPRELRSISEAAVRSPLRWDASAKGRPAVTVIGSGAWRDASPRPALNRVLRITAENGRSEILAEGPFVRLELAPNGRFVALLERGERLQPTAQRRPQGDWGVATEARRLAVLDLRTDALTHPCSGDFLETQLGWSPSGDRLLTFLRSPGQPWTRGAFHLVEVERGGACLALNGTGLSPHLRLRPEAVEATWLAGQPIVRARSAVDRKRRADWWRLSRAQPENLTARLPDGPDMLTIKDGRVFALAGGRLWRLGRVGRWDLLQGTGLQPLGGSLDQSRSSAGGEVLFRDPRSRLYGLDGPIGLALANGERALSISRAEQTLLVIRSTTQGVLSLEARSARRGARVLAQVNDAYRDIEPPRMLPIRHTGPGGQELTSWLFLPVRRAARPALIVRPYLGDDYRTPPPARPPVLGLAADVRVLVGAGYAVLMPSLPVGEGDHAPLHGLATRVLDIVDAAARQAPGTFDPARLALWGHSYGGYTTMGIIGQSDRFKAAIAMNAPMNLISIYGTFQPSWRVSPEDGVWPSWPAGWAEDSQGRMDAPPWQVPERYMQNSPLFLAEAIRTPVMLIHSDQDLVPLPQAEEMFSALYRQNKDAVIVTYWGEGHIISSPGNVRDLYERAFRWFDRYLAPVCQSPQRPNCEESGT